MINTREDFVKLINYHKFTTVVEVGVQNGFFSDILLQSTLTKLYLIDSWQYIDNYIDIANVNQDQQNTIYNNVYQKYITNNRVTIIRKLSVDASILFDDLSIDMIYIDANHKYEAVLQDIKCWYPKIKYDGIISGHDYLDGLRPEGNFGVKSAVQDFISEYKINNLSISNEPIWKSWYFYKELK